MVSIESFFIITLIIWENYKTTKADIATYYVTFTPINSAQYNRVINRVVKKSWFGRKEISGLSGRCSVRMTELRRGEILYQGGMRTVVINGDMTLTCSGRRSINGPVAFYNTCPNTLTFSFETTPQLGVLLTELTGAVLHKAEDAIKKGLSIGPAIVHGTLKAGRRGMRIVDRLCAWGIDKTEPAPRPIYQQAQHYPQGPVYVQPNVHQRNQ